MIYKIYINTKISIELSNVTITPSQTLLKYWNPEKDVLSTVISIFDIFKFLFEKINSSKRKGKFQFHSCLGGRPSIVKALHKLITSPKNEVDEENQEFQS